MKGCGKALGDEDVPFYCGKECDWCDGSPIHYCEECRTHSLNKESSK